MDPWGPIGGVLQYNHSACPKSSERSDIDLYKNLIYTFSFSSKTRNLIPSPKQLLPPQKKNTYFSVLRSSPGEVLLEQHGFSGTSLGFLSALCLLTPTLTGPGVGWLADHLAPNRRHRLFAAVAVLNLGREWLRERAQPNAATNILKCWFLRFFLGKFGEILRRSRQLMAIRNCDLAASWLQLLVNIAWIGIRQTCAYQWQKWECRQKVCYIFSYLG